MGVAEKPPILGGVGRGGGASKGSSAFAPWMGTTTLPRLLQEALPVSRSASRNTSGEDPFPARGQGRDCHRSSHGIGHTCKGTLGHTDPGWDPHTPTQGCSSHTL